ncbi:MAG: diaminopimelate epimerase [Bacillota bacterium]
MEIKFTKMHGLGNDFVVIDNTDDEYLLDDRDLVKRICKRRFGVGADGILEILSTPAESKYDFEIKIHNSDGSMAEMCGNGIRCISHYIKTTGLSNESKLQLKTGAGLIIPELKELNLDNNEARVRVNLGDPMTEFENLPVRWPELKKNKVINEEITIKDQKFIINVVSMGNPHTIIFVKKDPDLLPWVEWGKILENARIFPEKTNVEFAHIIDRDNIKVNVWERGAGATMACGTGAAATLTAGSLNDLVEKTAKIHLPGGTLAVEWLNDGIYIEGKSKLVYTGALSI